MEFDMDVPTEFGTRLDEAVVVARGLENALNEYEQLLRRVYCLKSETKVEATEVNTRLTRDYGRRPTVVFSVPGEQVHDATLAELAKLSAAIGEGIAVVNQFLTDFTAVNPPYGNNNAA
jgi:hypothetical protein